MAFSLPNIVIKPYLVTLFHERSPPLCSFALWLRNTKVPVWTHESIGYPKMDISHWDAAIHYGVQLAEYFDQTLTCYAISRRSPPLCSFALRLRNTKVPVLTHEFIGYPKMDISHWDAAIHYGVQLAQYCDPTRSFNVNFRKSPPPPPPVSGNTLTSSVIFKTFRDIRVSFTSTRIICLLAVLNPIL